MKLTGHASVQSNISSLEAEGQANYPKHTSIRGRLTLLPRWSDVHARKKRLRTELNLMLSRTSTNEPNSNGCPKMKCNQIE